MKLSKNTITVIISTVVLLVCVAVSYAESKSEEGHNIVITPNQSGTSQSSYSEALNERPSSTTVSAKTPKSKTSKSSKTTVKNRSKTSAASTAVTFDFPADINTASFDMLCAVNGIGEVTANNILSYRESIGGFKSMYDLLDVSGIGEKKLEVLMKYFYVTNDMGSKTTSQATASTSTQTSKTTTSYTNTYKTTKASTVSSARIRKMVNINTADADELEEALLISREMAEEIVEVRGLISGYTNIRELLMVEDFTAALLVELDEYLLL